MFFQYKTETVRAGQDLDGVLNSLGAEGWELVHADRNLFGTWTIVLKRVRRAG